MRGAVAGQTSPNLSAQQKKNKKKQKKKKQRH
jgi:hypothetical protein